MLKAWLGHVLRRIGMWAWLLCLLTIPLFMSLSLLYFACLVGYVGLVEGETSWTMAGISVVLFYCSWWLFRAWRRHVKRFRRKMRKENGEWEKYKIWRREMKKIKMIEEMERKIAKARGEKYPWDYDLDMDTD
jgi:flagellar biosynthesis component FlhA